MLEVFYETATKIATAWRSEGRQDVRPVREGESRVMLDILPPSNPNASVRDYLYDESMQSLELGPNYRPPEPPRSVHVSVVDAIDTDAARPARIKRVWEGQAYFYDCLVAESVKDQFVAGDIVVGDYVVVHFDGMGEQIVMAKIFKSW